MCYLGNPGPLLAGTLLGQVWAEREEKLRAGAGKAKASRLRLGYVWQGYWDWKQARDLAEGDGGAALDRQALRHQSSSLLWLWGEGVKQCWAFSLPLPR